MARRTTAHKGHPLLNPQNGITFRLLPGLIIGALLQRWFSTQAPKVCRECVPAYVWHGISSFGLMSLLRL